MHRSWYSHPIARMTALAQRWNIETLFPWSFTERYFDVKRAFYLLLSLDHWHSLEPLLKCFTLIRKFHYQSLVFKTLPCL